MSIYDTVTKKQIQIKCTPGPCLHHYFVGKHIPLKDGLYIGYEGWFTVKGGKVFDFGDKAFTKWGDIIFLEKIMEYYSIIERMFKFKKMDYNDIFKINDYIEKLKKEKRKVIK